MAAGAITIYGHSRTRLVIRVPTSEIAGCEIVERQDISTLGRTLLLWAIYGETGAVGCPLALFLGPAALLDAIVAKKARFPVLKLTQAAGDDDTQGWVIHLRSRKRRRRGRTETMAMAQRITTFLRQRGHGGPMPSLKND